MENVIILAVLAVVLVLAVRYVVKAKKSGRKCVGCPESCCPINSIVPTTGTAVVTISAETMDLTVSLEDLLHQLGEKRGVVKAEVLAG